MTAARWWQVAYDSDGNSAAASGSKKARHDKDSGQAAAVLRNQKYSESSFS
jgi:hypothetical protein